MKIISRNIWMLVTAFLLLFTLLSCNPSDPMAKKSFSLEVEKSQAVYIFQKVKEDPKYYLYIVDKYSNKILVFVDRDADQMADYVVMLSRSGDELKKLSEMQRSGAKGSQIETFLEADAYIKEGYKLMLDHYNNGKREKIKG